MGKGDRKTRRGKIWQGTYGVKRRPQENQRDKKGDTETTKKG